MNTDPAFTYRELINSKYIYYLTDEYPFVPRCLKGNVSKDFNNRRN